MRRRTVLLAASLVLGGLAVVPAQATEWVTCTVEGDAGTYQIKRIDFDTDPTNWPNLGLLMELWRPRPFTTDARGYHSFGGMWLLAGNSRLRTNSYSFFDLPYWTGSPVVRLNLQGQGVIEQRPPEGHSLPQPGESLLVDGVHGAYRVNPDLMPGTYYLVGFGDGGGRYRSTVRLRFPMGTPAEGIGCTDVDWPGRVISYNASDFQGGTQVAVPGYASVTDGVLEFTNPYTNFLSGFFFYEPDPLPPATVHITADDESGTLSQLIRPYFGGATDWRLVGNFTGKTDTILWSMLQIDLPCSPSRPPCPDWLTS